MKILIVNQVFYPDVSATSQYLTDLALELAKRNHEITVLTARCGYAFPWPLFPKQENYNGIRILRVWPFLVNKNSRSLRICHSLFLNISLSFKILQHMDYDRVLALTSPPMIGWFCSLVSRFKKIKMMYWLMDINPDEAIEAGWIRKDCFQAKLLSKLLNWTLRNSHRIICLDTHMKRRIIAKGVDEKSIKVTPPWSSDTELPTIPHDQNPFRRKNGLIGKFVVLYAGNHSVCHPLQTMLEAAVIFKDDSSIKFVFVGGGERTAEVANYKKSHNLDNVIQLPYLPRNDLKYLLSAADLHVAVMGNGYVGIVHPCKIYGILAIGRPFVYIGPEESHITQIMRDHKVGYEVRHGQTNELAGIIKAAMHLSESEKDSIMQSEKAAAEKFSQKSLCSELADIISNE